MFHFETARVQGRPDGTSWRPVHLGTVRGGAIPQGTRGTYFLTSSSFGRTDFRDDLAKMTVPTLIFHGDSNGPLSESRPGGTPQVDEGAPNTGSSH